jgi:hypothetical protein
MSHRDRQAAPPPTAADRSVRAGDGWDVLFDALPPALRHELLDRASAGPITADQLPSVTPGTDAGRQLLTRLLAGQGFDELAPLPPDWRDPVSSARTAVSSDLDPQQRAAVAAAMRTPDLVLVQGQPGTGKSRVAAEVIAQAAARGERALLVAASPAGLDRTLELLADRPGVRPLRLVGRDETNPESQWTLSAQTRRWREATAAGARARLEAARARSGRRAAEAPVFDQLADLAEQWRRVDARRQELNARARAERKLRDEGKSLGFFGAVSAFVTNLLSPKRAAQSAAEAERREAAWADETAALDGEAAVLGDKWRQAVRGGQWAVGSDEEKSLMPTADCPMPTALLPAARADWQLRRDADDREYAAAKEWADALPALSEQLPTRLMHCANVAAATPAALAADPYFGTAACPPFDLLLLEEAHEICEAEFLAAARRARRWVLVGEPTPEAVAGAAGHAAADVPTPNRGSGTRRSNGWAAPSTLRPGFFQRLWRHLHWDAWVRDGGRLVCRLRPVSPSQRPSLACEPLADRPEVELRIQAATDGMPQLAEVAFPPDTGLPAAKAFLFRELGEAPIPAPCAAPRWVETPDAVRCALFETDGVTTGVAHRADLGGGVCELVGQRTGDGGGPAPWFTAALEFTRAMGWDRPKAEAWVRTHVGRHGPARTIRLDTPHRMTPALAGVVADLLGNGVHANGSPPQIPVTTGDVVASPVEFVAVPSVERNGNAGPPHLQRRGGAGFEIDLADSRQRTHLPPDMRDTLPARGVVNLVEARAVVERLERLIAERAPSPVGVLALTAAQATLVRHLAARSKALAGSDITVTVPPGLRQREVRTLVVSLTRSHTNRAVFYGEEPTWLPLALARGRERLILVGDLGTLARRAQWDGPLDHLDAAAARRERDFADHLVGYVQGRGRHARAFRVLTGAGP